MPETPATAQRAVPYLWFPAGQAEAAAARYAAIFGGRVLDTMRMNGEVLSCTVEILGLRLVALDGNRGPPFTDAFSLQVPCATQAEIDRLWDALLEGGGVETMCGWLRDRWGVAWQIVPAELPRLLANPRAIQAMLAMKKLDIAALERA